jgi:competence protein ComEC
MSNRFMKISALLLIGLLLFSACSININMPTGNVTPAYTTGSLQATTTPTGATTSNIKQTAASEQLDAFGMDVHFIDVGQGDCEFIQTDTATMLIDSGNPDDATHIIAYIKALGVKKIDYVLATHPHADHIGSMAKIIKAFDIGTIIMSRATTNTKTYEGLLDAISAKHMAVTVPKEGQAFKLGSNATCKVISAPIGPFSSDDLNLYSIVVRISYGNSDFLFCGDAQTFNEEAMQKSGLTLSSEVIKIGHHGSNTSSSEGFITAVNPISAVICCGKNNDYGFPKAPILARLAAHSVRLFRTDLDGNIKMMTDGNTITCDGFIIKDRVDK